MCLNIRWVTRELTHGIDASYTVIDVIWNNDKKNYVLLSYIGYILSNVITYLRLNFS